jgi:hypothetical protein
MDTDSLDSHTAGSRVLYLMLLDEATTHSTTQLTPEIGPINNAPGKPLILQVPPLVLA